MIFIEKYVDLTLFDVYKKELQKIGWKIQYREKVKRRKEFISDDISFKDNGFYSKLENEIYLTQLIDSLPSEIGQKIIYKVYIEDKTEKEVAKELYMSQQGVNKCKNKMLKLLYQMMNSQN